MRFEEAEAPLMEQRTVETITLVRHHWRPWSLRWLQRQHHQAHRTTVC
jgi:hypothetical protein